MKSFGFATIVVALIASNARAVVIDFEAYPGPDGELGTMDDVDITAPAPFADQLQQITTQYASLGIVFLPNPAIDDQSEILDDISFYRSVGSRPNLLSTSRDKFPFGPLEARFTVPVRSVTMAIGLGLPSFSPPNRLEIFDVGGGLIDSIVASNSFVTLNSSVDIARFRVTATSAVNQAVIDDVTFTPVPEPALAGPLWIAGLLAMRQSRPLKGGTLNDARRPTVLKSRTQSARAVGCG